MSAIENPFRQKCNRRIGRETLFKMGHLRAQVSAIAARDRKDKLRV
jgi:hypothetical protein